MYNLAILDDYASLSPQRFSSLPPTILSQLSITTFTHSIPPSDLAHTLHPFHIICTTRERTKFPRDLVERLPNLKLLTTNGMRNLALDLEAFREKGVVVTGSGKGGLPDNPAVTAQHCVALILGLTSNLVRDHNSLTDGSGSWLNHQPLNFVLPGKTYASLGLGNLGGQVASIMKQAFGMKVIAWSENLTQEKADEMAEKQGLGKGSYEVVGKEELFKRADVLAVHVVLSDRTRGIISTAELALMKPTSFLINTSRGPLIDESALLSTLNAGSIRGAAIDVFDIEPLPVDSPWRTSKWGKEGRSEVILTPHGGYAYEEVLRGWWEVTVRRVEAFVKGEELGDRLC